MGPADLAHIKRGEALGVDREMQDAERLVGHGGLHEQAAAGVPGRRGMMDRPVAATGQGLAGKALVVDQHVERDLVGHVAAHVQVHAQAGQADGQAVQFVVRRRQAQHRGGLGAVYKAWIVLSVTGLMGLALAAYAAYLINATQFVLKLRAARLQEADSLRRAAVA